MRIPKRAVPIGAGVVLTALLGVAAFAMRPKPAEASPLGIEIALAKPFYIPAGKTTMVVIRVPDADSSSGTDVVSAIKLEPRMDGAKVKVSVFALVGEADMKITNCRDWNALKAVPVGSYVAGVDEEVSLVKLKDFGVRFGNDPLTFRVVPRKILSPLPPQHEPLEGGGCDCASCGGLICCPNPGQCITCGGCGQVCCSGG